ncbi:thiamine phosphate synthase [Erythrobacter sp. JK5]|uniref:thiamine phosphate synthase n=1 Tax=Erythrobacter sp. JK5 TaxID=2829500 RepID=UPI002010E69B|nr:thiamine phosphate synthase [Erythrobacter sp. JK5]
MVRDQSPNAALPLLWLLSDARNDAALETAIARLPAGSGFVFRHYHLPQEARAARFASVLPLLRAGQHWAIVSASHDIAAQWGADGVYGPFRRMPPAGMKWIATAHDEDELVAADRGAADAVMLSPVFPTRSHPRGEVLGIDEFHRLARACATPVIALGGMTAERARKLEWPRWAAIDGLS